MQAAELTQAADELYALPPGEFRAARDERARQARAAGDRELAAAIGKLRRPTVSAWLVNQLVREAGDQVGELLALGAELREAQSGLAGDRLRELSGRRRELVRELTRAAGRLAREAGQRVSEQTERELGGTLEAALADPAAATAVASGRLAGALSYAGLGSIDVSGAVAVPDALTGQGGRPARPAGGRGAEAARRDLAEAADAARDAEAALADAQQWAATAAGEHEAARRRIGELERDLEAARRAETRAGRVARDARRDRDAAARSLTAAQRRLARARDRAGGSA